MASWRTDFAGGGSGGTGNRAVTVTPAVGDLCVVFVVVSANANLTPTMSDNNSDASTYTLIRTARKATSADTMSVFVRDKLFSNTTSTIITAATGSNTAGELVAVHITGMSKTGPGAVRQSAIQENQSSGGTPAPAFSSSALTGNMTLGAVGNATNPATLTFPTSWTERKDVGQASPATGLEVVTRDSGFTGTTITWGGTSASAFADIIIELDNNPVIEEEDTFWDGFNRSVVMGIAAATLTSSIAMASIGQNTAVGDPAASEIIEGVPDSLEDEYWQNPVPSVIQMFYQQLPYLPDGQDDPSGSLLNSPGTTEDYWQIVQDQLPYKKAFSSGLEDDIVPQPEPANPDEDYWGTPGSVAPPDLYPETLFLPFPLGSYGSDATTGAPPNVGEDYTQIVQDIHGYKPLPYAIEANEDCRFPLFGVIVEDYNWSLLYGFPRPVEASLYQSLPYLPDPEELTMDFQGVANPEEDYWINPVAPVPASQKLNLPYHFEIIEVIQGGELFGAFEDDSWQNPVLPVQAGLYQQLPYNPDPEELVFNFITIQEDYWLSPVPIQIQQAKNGPILFWDSGEISYFASIAENDDYWQTLVFPIPAKMYQSLPILYDAALDHYIFFGEIELRTVSAKPLVTMDISIGPLTRMGIRVVK